MAARMATIDTVIISSMSEKPFCRESLRVFTGTSLGVMRGLMGRNLETLGRLAAGRPVQHQIDLLPFREAVHRLSGEASRLDVKHVVIHLDGLAHRRGGDRAADLIREHAGAPPDARTEKERGAHRGNRITALDLFH